MYNSSEASAENDGSLGPITTNSSSTKIDNEPEAAPRTHDSMKRYIGRRRDGNKSTLSG
jgi:hypothetical protein